MKCTYFRLHMLDTLRIIIVKFHSRRPRKSLWICRRKNHLHWRACALRMWFILDQLEFRMPQIHSIEIQTLKTFKAKPAEPVIRSVSVKECEECEECVYSVLSNKSKSCSTTSTSNRSVNALALGFTTGRPHISYLWCHSIATTIGSFGERLLIISNSILIPS